MQGRTTFIIAHRLSTVRFADRILVLKAGEMIEEGTHEELLNRGGEYHKLHKMQQGIFAGSVPKVFGSLFMVQPKVFFGGPNSINGWVIADNNEQISRVRIMGKDKVLGKGLVDKEMPKVAEKFPNYHHSLKSGFRVDFEALDDPDVTYKVQVIDMQNRILKTREIRLMELEASPSVAI